MRVKIVGCLGPIAVRQGNVDTNKVGCYTKPNEKNRALCSVQLLTLFNFNFFLL